MAGRSYWKGHLRLSLVSCAVALYPAVGSSSQLTCHTINRKTGNRINEEIVDAVTREPVPREDRVKGCEVARNDLVPIEDDELEQIRLESTHTLNIESFVRRSEVDERYFDRPYYLAPEDKVSREAFAVIRDAMSDKKKAGLGRLVIARRERLALIEPFERGMLVTMLRSADEVRSPTATFEDIAHFEAPDDMRELAAQLIERNSAPFDPSKFEDRYEQALIALVRSKAKPSTKSGAKGPANDDAAPSGRNVVNLMEALKRSIHAEKAASGKGTSGKAAASPKPVPSKTAGGRPAAASKQPASKRSAAALKKAS